MVETIYDSIIIGGGPAGLSAAIYLARFNRTVLVVDKEDGRSTYPQINENYLGFPEGIHVRQLRKLGKKQAEQFGEEFVYDEVENVTKVEDLFSVTGKQHVFHGKTIIFATGVVDIFPEFHNFESYIGKSLFWCITCDGCKTKGKKVIVVGKDDEAATTCLQFLNFTKHLVFLSNCNADVCELTQVKREQLLVAGITVIESSIHKINGRDGFMESVILENGQEIEVDFMFNQQGAVPNSMLAQKLGVSVDKFGYILTDSEQRTNIQGIYAAGDVTKLFAHQVVTAAHEGSMAGQAVNYDLYRPEQRV